MARKPSTLKKWKGKKRKFYGNRFTKKGLAPEAEPLPQPETDGLTSAERRIRIMRETIDEPTVSSLDDDEKMLIVSYHLINSLVQLAKCGDCGDTGEIDWKLANRKGYAHQINVTCSQCGKELLKQYTSESKTIRSPTGKIHMHHQVNTRVIFAAQRNGVHLAKLTDLTNMAGIEGDIQRRAYSKILELVEEYSMEAGEQSLYQARKMLKSELNSEDEITDICVSYDGTWQKRGHKSPRVGHISDQKDKTRIYHAKQIPETTQNRKRKRIADEKLYQQQLEEEGPSYVYGGF